MSPNYCFLISHSLVCGLEAAFVWAYGVAPPLTPDQSTANQPTPLVPSWAATSTDLGTAFDQLKYFWFLTSAFEQKLKYTLAFQRGHIDDEFG